MTPEKPKENGEAAANDRGVKVEHWEADEYVLAFGGAVQGQTLHKRDAESVARWLRTCPHVLACVNVLAGIADPEAEIRRPREVEKAADAMAEAASTACIESGDGDAPSLGLYNRETAAEAIGDLSLKQSAYRTARGPREAASHEKGAA